MHAPRRDRPRTTGWAAVAALLMLVGCSDDVAEDDGEGGGGDDGPFGTVTGTDGATGTSTGAGTGTGTGDAGCPEGDPVMCGIVAAHNAVRANVNPAANPPMPALTWNADAAAVASEWASGCVFGHNPQLGNLSLGENVYMTSATATPQAVVDAWASEVSDYNYANNSCSGVCGHYTQIVWAATTSVGCAYANCPNGQMWVCDYAPPGNYIGQSPY